MQNSHWAGKHAPERDAVRTAIRWLLVLYSLCALAACGNEAPPGDPHAHRLNDISEALGLNLRSRTWAATSGDLNADGLTDILVVWHSPRPETLFFNTGSGFTASPLGSPADRHHCVSADVNQDARMDVYCTVGARRGKGHGNNNLYIQQPDGSFADMAEAYAVTDPWGRGRYATFLNANGDAYPDLFVGNTPARMDENSSSNRLFINVNGIRFRDAQDYRVSRPEDAHCALAADVNADGFDELLVCEQSGVKLYANEAGRAFRDATDTIVSKRQWRKAAWIDFDRDGLLDIALLNRRLVNILRQANGRYETVLFAAELETGQDMAVSDINNDGFDDLFVLQSGCERNERIAAAQDSFAVISAPSGRWQRADAPRSAEGCAGNVLAVNRFHGDRNGFLVLNGEGKSQGYVQFLVTQPRER